MRISSRPSSSQKTKCVFSLFFFLFPADGIFGRCQQVPVIDIYKYDISAPVLQHLRIILEQLSHRGTVRTLEGVRCTGGCNYFCSLWGDVSRSFWTHLCFSPAGADFIKKPLDSLSLPGGAGEAIPGEVFPPRVAHVTDTALENVSIHECWCHTNKSAGNKKSLPSAPQHISGCMGRKHKTSS